MKSNRGEYRYLKVSCNKQFHICEKFIYNVILIAKKVNL